MRKEVERFILWGLHVRGKKLSQMGVMDIRAYVKFMVDPQPLEVWVSATKRPRLHPDWRPFAGPLSKSYNLFFRHFPKIALDGPFFERVQGSVDNR